MKKILLAVMSIAVMTSGVFAEGISFSNELVTNVVNVFDPKNGESNTSYFDTTERVIADCEVDIIKAGVDAKGYFRKSNRFDKNSNYKLSWDSADWYVEFNPFEIVGFGFSDELYTAGSYLPVVDEKVNAGNYSTSGFSLLIRPAENLTIGVGVDNDATYFADNNNDEWEYNLAAGIDYNDEQFSIGGSFHGIGTDDHLKIGIYGSIKAIDNFLLNVGFTHSEDGDIGLNNVTYISNQPYKDDSNITRYINDKYFCIWGKNVVNAGAVIDVDVVKISGDLAFSLDSDDRKGLYDFYLGADVLLGLTNELGIDIKGFMLNDFGDTDEDMTFGLKPRLLFKMDKHEFSVGLFYQSKLGSNNGYKSFGLPLGWKYVY